MNWGGVEIAAISVLKAVITIHRIGKNMMMAMAQPAIPAHSDVDLKARAAMASPSIVEVAGDGPDQERRDDVGEYDGDDAAGRCAAHVPLQERPEIDEVGQVGGGRARSARGRDEDLGEDREQEDRLDHDDDRDRPQEM